MIVQQINLYQDRFREKRIWVSTGQVLGLLFLIVAVAGLWSLKQKLDISAAQQLATRLDAERDQLAADMAVAEAELQRLLADRRLEGEITSARKEINARRRVLQFVEANRFGSGEGFSDNLEALARLQIDDLWLNRIRIAEDYLAIEGSTLEAALVPEYFSRFSGESVFAGGRFDLFDLERPEDADWKVDFRISTRGDADG